MSAAPHAPVSLTRRALPYAALLFLLVGAHGLLETARDGLFLVEQPVTRLPWLYLAVTAGVLLLTPVQRRLWSGRLHVALPLTMLTAAAVTLGFWAFAAARSTVLGFYVWTALFSSLVFVQFWLTADEAFSVDEAKRAFGFIAAGGLLGAVFGTGAARIALDWTYPRTLLLISAGATVAGAGLALVGVRPSCQGPEAQPEMTAARAMPGYVKRDPYLRLLAVLALLTAASATLIDYLFKAAVAAGITPERIPRLVANVYLGQSALALVVELVLVGLLLRSSGVTRSLALLPLVVLAGATGYAVGAGLVAMLILKTLDGGLRPSLYRVGTELLFLPIGPAERRVVKPSIDTLGQRGGQALASLLLLALPLLPERHQMAAATVCLALVGVAWVQATVVLRRRYLERFQRELGAGRVTTASIERLDLATAEVLVAGLGSSSVREVLAALEVLAGSGRLGLVPALILYHPDPIVVRSALRLLSRSQRPDVDALLPFLLRHPDDQVRAMAAERWAGGGHPPNALSVTLDDPSPKVRASALIALSAGPDGAGAVASLAAIAAGPDLQSRRALAWAIGNAPRPDLLPVIETLFLSGDVETRRELLRAAPGLPTPPPEFVSHLISLLAEPILRPGVRDALVSIGTPALVELERLLLGPDTPYALVRELPACIARFPAEPATGPLLRRLVQARGGLDRFRSLRALNQLRRTHPRLPLDSGRARVRARDRAPVGVPEPRAPARRGRPRHRAEGRPRAGRDPAPGPPSRSRAARNRAHLPRARAPLPARAAGAGLPGHPLRGPPAPGRGARGVARAAPGALARAGAGAARRGGARSRLHHRRARAFSDPRDLRRRDARPEQRGGPAAHALPRPRAGLDGRRDPASRRSSLLRRGVGRRRRGRHPAARAWSGAGPCLSWIRPRSPSGCSG